MSFYWTKKKKKRNLRFKRAAGSCRRTDVAWKLALRELKSDWRRFIWRANVLAHVMFVFPLGLYNFLDLLNKLILSYIRDFVPAPALVS